MSEKFLVFSVSRQGGIALPKCIKQVVSGMAAKAPAP
jgi:hypothetical protein